MDNDFHVKESPMPTMIGLGGGATGLSISGLVKPTEALYTNPGTYNWECPAGVTSVSVVVVGSGGKGSDAGSRFILCWSCWNHNGIWWWKWSV